MNTIWVIAGGPSTEFEISLKSAITIARNIEHEHVQIRPVMLTRDSRWLLSRRYISKLNPETEWLEEFYTPTEMPSIPYSNLNMSQMMMNLVDDEVSCACLLALHGQVGEDGCIQALFELANIPYTGSAVGPSAIAFHKARTKEAMRTAGITVPKHILFTKRSPSIGQMPTFPVIVKPASGGSSLGISLVTSQAELMPALQTALAVDTEVMIEEFVHGIEVSCSVIDLIEDGKMRTVALPPTLIKPKTGTFFDYKAKYEIGGSDEITPAPLPQEVTAAIQDVAIRAHQTVGCEGISRTDMILTQANPLQPVALEINTLPGMTETSILPAQAAAAGISIPQLIRHTIEHAMWRHAKKNGSQ